MENPDLIIVGAGPAGLAAGISAVFYDFKTMIFEEKLPRGLVLEIPVRNLGLSFNTVSTDRILARVK
jgi:thioredoxin reductase